MLDENEDLVLNEIYSLTHAETKNWQKLTEIGKTLHINTKRKLLWVWPTPDDLINLKNELSKLGIRKLLSIGCGNGLLEWILKESTGVEVFGLEIDRNWWQSKYAVKSFIDLNYIEDASTLENNSNNKEYLSTCCGLSKDWSFALLFCYFNNRQAFLNYLEMYEGKWIIIIGPDSDLGFHTDPEPLKPQFPTTTTTKWQLSYHCQWTEQNIITIYEKVN